MKRTVALLGLGLVLFAGVAVAQQSPSRPSPERAPTTCRAACAR
jgi:hypothetical protein